MNCIRIVLIVCAGILSADAIPPIIYNLTINYLEFHTNKVLDRTPSRCSKDLKHLFRAVKLQELWALQMLDATAKGESGLASGNIRQIGDYEQCLKVKNAKFKGKYCSMTAIPDIDFVKSLASKFDVKDIEKSYIAALIQPLWGICIPSTCRPSDILRIVDEVRQMTNATSVPLDVYMLDAQCSTSTQKPFELTFGALATICLFSVVIVVAILATIFDVFVYQKDSEHSFVDEIIVAFSLYSNGAKLLGDNPAELHLVSINGIRSLCMLWIVFAHTCLAKMLTPITNLIEMTFARYNLDFAFVAGANYAVDTFFFISGFLIVYVYLHWLHVERQTITIWQFYLHRFIRLVPLLCVVLLIVTYLLEHLGDGPIWESFTKEMLLNNCKQTWWPTLLFVQNYIGVWKNCMPTYWYLASDTQLYILAPILLFGLRKYPRVTVVFIIMLLGASISYAYQISYEYKFGATFSQYNRQYFHHFYPRTEIKMSSWLVGTLYGYFFTTGLFKKPLNAILAVVIWMVQLTLMTTIVFSQAWLESLPYDATRSAVINALFRPLWAQAIGWAIYACYKKRGWLIESLLSLHIFRVISRLSYSMYITHVLIIVQYYGTQSSTRYFSYSDVIAEAIYIFAVTFFVAFGLSLLFEAPILSLEKLIIRQHLQKTRRADKKE